MPGFASAWQHFLPDFKEEQWMLLMQGTVLSLFCELP